MSTTTSTTLKFTVQRDEQDDAREARWDNLVLGYWGAGFEVVGGGPHQDEPLAWETPDGKPWDGTTFPVVEVWELVPR